jgi:hypothetical protein
VDLRQPTGMNISAYREHPAPAAEARSAWGRLSLMRDDYGMSLGGL